MSLLSRTMKRVSLYITRPKKIVPSKRIRKCGDLFIRQFYFGTCDTLYPVYLYNRQISPLVPSGTVVPFVCSSRFDLYGDVWIKDDMLYNKLAKLCKKIQPHDVFYCLLDDKKGNYRKYD